MNRIPLNRIFDVDSCDPIVGQEPNSSSCLLCKIITDLK